MHDLLLSGMSSSNRTVLFLGPVGTYTHQAAFNRFGSDAVYTERSTISDIFSSLSSNEVGVVPQENSTFGSVIETYDCLLQTNCHIQGEITLRIQHCLLVRNGTKTEDIDCIMSHEQALGQCHEFISQTFPNVCIKTMSSTAAAASALLSGVPNAAAICSRICAAAFKGTNILFEGIQDRQDNFTRFYILGRSTLDEAPEGSESSALLRVSHAKEINQILIILGLPVRRIDRRPTIDGMPFENTYFIEVFLEFTEDEIHSWKSKLENCIRQAKTVDVVIELIGLW